METKPTREPKKSLRSQLCDEARKAAETQAKLEAVAAELAALRAELAKPFTTARFVGGPFGTYEERIDKDPRYMVGQTVTTREELLWKVVAQDDSDPMERKASLQ